MAALGSAALMVDEPLPSWLRLSCKLASALGIAGLGFVARDNNVTSEDVGASSPASAKPPGPGRFPLLALLGAALLLPACGTLDPAGPYKGDQVTYRADLAITTSYDLLHTFVKWEYDNRAALKQWPEVRKSADFVRANAKRWISSAVAAREAYSRAPAEDTRAALERALAVLRTATAEALAYYSTL